MGAAISLSWEQTPLGRLSLKQLSLKQLSLKQLSLKQLSLKQLSLKQLSLKQLSLKQLSLKQLSLEQPSTKYSFSFLPALTFLSFISILFMNTFIKGSDHAEIIG